MGKLKRFKRITSRCKKTADSYGALVAFACSLILVISVHTAQYYLLLSPGHTFCPTASASGEKTLSGA
jgi:hypothetical protein